MSAMSDGVSKVWVQRFAGGLSIEGFTSDRNAALALAYRVISTMPEQQARKEIESFALTLNGYVDADYAEPPK